MSKKCKAVLYFGPAAFSPRFANGDLIPLTAEISNFTLASDRQNSCEDCCLGFVGGGSNQHVVYQLLVKYGREKLLLERRFSDFEALHAELSKTYVSLEMPALPSKTWLFTPLDDINGFLTARRQALATWLDTLLNNLNARGLIQCPAVTEFLDLAHLKR